MYHARSVRIASVSIAAMVSGLAVEAAAQQQTAEKMQGRVVDEDGKPIAGAEVTARYQVNGGGSSNQDQQTGYSDADGYYSVSVRQPKGTWAGFAYANVEGWRLELVPDEDKIFAGSDGAIRNFALRFLERRGLDDPKRDYGIGGFVIVDRAPLEFPDLGKVQLTLRSVADGASITRQLRETYEGYIVSGLRPGEYELTASLNGRRMLLSPDTVPKQWASSYRAGFETKSGIYRMHVLVKEASGGSMPPPPPGSTPPPPASTAGFLQADAPAQNLGRWIVRSTGVHYPGEQDPNIVVAFVAKNISPLAQAANGSFRLVLNGASTYQPADIRYEILSASNSASGLAPYMSTPVGRPTSSVKGGEEAVVYASFRVDPAARQAVKSVKITGIEKPASPLLGKEREVGTITIALPAGPKTSAPTPTPTPTPAPTPTPTPTPTPPPDTSGDPIPVQGSVFNLGRWSVRVSEVHYKTPTSMTVSITAKNKTLASLSPLSAFEFALQSRTKTTAKHVTYARTYPVAATNEVAVTAWFDLPKAEQEAVNSITVTEVAQPKQGMLLKAQPATSVPIPVQPRRANAPPPAEETGAPKPPPSTTPTPPAEKAAAAATSDFRDTGYFFTRLDGVRRQPSGAVEVTLMMRNDQNVRRSIWNNYNSWTLIGSDGMSYKHDGNGYGRNGADKMTTTVWLEKDGSNLLTYVYKVPPSVKPVRLVVRDYYGKNLTEFDLTSALSAP